MGFFTELFVFLQGMMGSNVPMSPDSLSPGAKSPYFYNKQQDMSIKGRTVGRVKSPRLSTVQCEFSLCESVQTLENLQP